MNFLTFCSAPHRSPQEQLMSLVHRIRFGDDQTPTSCIYLGNDFLVNVLLPICAR